MSSIPRLIIAASLLLAGFLGAAAEEQYPLVDYDFDAREIETGPDTVMVFQNARGSVKLSNEYRFSGHRSVEVRDVAGDGDFTELQGFFSHQSAGSLYFHFALMTAEPDESLNVALAGKSYFILKEDGIAFWLGTRDGVMFHRTGGRVVPLLEPLAFVWYEVDVTYRIEAGIYDLTIHQEGLKEPVVELRDQPNAVSEPGSKVSMFSFIGDPPGFDDSQVRFYVDDIYLSADAPVEQGPYVAPGRRVLFIDLWDHYRRLLYDRPGCLPAIEPRDFGFTDADLRDLIAADLLDRYAVLATRDGSVSLLRETPLGYLATLLHGMELWGRGCRSRPSCEEPPCAEDYFSEAAFQVPQSKLYPMSEVLALAAKGSWEEADEIWMAIYPDWADDPRFPAVSAQLGILAGDLSDTERYLETIEDPEPGTPEHPLVRQLWSGDLSHELALKLAAAFPEDWHELVRTALVADHRYYVLLWQGRLSDAGAYAASREAAARRMGIHPGSWLERRGDTAFWAGDAATARGFFEVALEGHSYPSRVYLKLSDVHYRLGDLERERYYREAIYGRLTEGTDSP